MLKIILSTIGGRLHRKLVEEREKKWSGKKDKSFIIKKNLCQIMFDTIINLFILNYICTLFSIVLILKSRFLYDQYRFYYIFLK